MDKKSRQNAILGVVDCVPKPRQGKVSGEGTLIFLASVVP
jgi:hypothetical protein